MNLLRYLVIVFFFGLITVSCTKDKDNRIPVITYYSPEPNAIFDISDSIPVHAFISDDKEVTTVRVNITNEEFVAVSPAQVFTANSASYELTTRIPILDETLESGTYYVLIRAENGVNFKNQYQKIMINGIDLEFIQAVIITPGSLNQLQVFGTQDFENTNLISTLHGDFAASEISSKDHLLFVAGRNIMNVQAIDLSSNTLAWKKEITPGVPIHNAGCLQFDELLYTTYNYQYIHGYSPSGSIEFDVFIDEFDAPERIFRHEDFVLVEMQKKNANNPFIATYFALTGDEKQRRFIDYDVIDFLALEKDYVIIVANRNGLGILLSYDIQNDIVSQLHENENRFNAAVLTLDGMITLAGEENIYSFNSNTGTFVTILNNGASRINFESLSGSLVLGQANKLSVYTYPEMVDQKTLLFSDTILDIRLLYSK